VEEWVQRSEKTTTYAIFAAAMSPNAKSKILLKPLQRNQQRQTSTTQTLHRKSVPLLLFAVFPCGGKFEDDHIYEKYPA